MTETDIVNRLENRLETLENMVIHIHEHLESLKVVLNRHDVRLMNISNTDDLNIDINRVDELEQYSPINEEDRLKNAKKLKEEIEERDQINEFLVKERLI